MMRNKDEVGSEELTIPEEMIGKWQNIVDIMAEIIDVPAALIMKAKPPYSEVFLSSNRLDNPFKAGDIFEMAGTYCEKVINTKIKLLVSNALQDKEWDSNPDLEYGFISYLGLPLLWPNGEVFGTICILDTKENCYSETYENWMIQFKEIIESHLHLEREITRRKRRELELLESEEKYHLVLDMQSDAIHVVDTDLRLEFINNSLKEWFNKLALDPDVLGRYFFEAFPFLPAKVCDEYRQVIESGKKLVTENAVQLGKQKFFIEIQKIPVLKDGKTTKVITIIKDITRHKQMEEAMSKTNEELERWVEERTFKLVEANRRLESEIAERKRMEKRARMLTQKLVSAQEEERKRISRELHDEAGQALTVLRIWIKMIEQELPEGLKSIHEHIKRIMNLCDGAIERIRWVAREMRPPALETVGLNSTLEQLCREFTCQMGLCIGYSGAELPKLTDTINITLYRCLQEALTNVVKHAQATQVQVDLACEAGTIILSVKDNGRGFDSQTDKNYSPILQGIGLLGIRERLDALNGHLNVDSQAGKGTRLIASISWQERNRS